MSDKNSLAVTGHKAIEPTSFTEAMSMAKTLAGSGLLPRELTGNPANVLAVLLVGHELGLGPMTALRAIHIVEGKPVLSADLMVSLVWRSGACESFREVSSDTQKAVYETKRVGQEPARAQFTIEEARTAGLVDRGKRPEMNNWNRYPAAMLRARARAILARQVYPDVLHGCYTPDEADEFVDMRETAPGRYSAPPPPAAEEPERSDVIDVAPTNGESDDLDGEVAALRAAIESHDFAAEPELPAEVTERLIRLPKDSEERGELRALYADRIEQARAQAVEQAQ